MAEPFQLPKRAKNLVGQRFGLLVAIKPIGINKWGKVNWQCLCDCGQTSVVASNALTQIRSCGCVHKLVGDRVRTHGMSYSALYAIWGSIKARCTNPTHRSYDGYGGRGIALCDEWNNSFDKFRAHVSSLPHFEEEGYSLDRINNNGNYEPGNVRWSTSTGQQRNTRHNRMITHNGKTQCLAAWAEESGINRHTIRSRIERGWSIDKALATPLSIGEPPDPIE